MKKVVVTIILAIILCVSGIALIENSKLKTNKVTGFEADAVLDKSDICDKYGYDIEDDVYKPENEDPQLYFQNFYLKVSSMKVVFKEPLEENLLIQVYGGGATALKYVHKGDKEVYIDFNQTTESSVVRIDINGEFILDSVQLSEKDFSIIQTGESKIEAGAYIIACVIAVILAIVAVYVINIFKKLKNACQWIKASFCDNKKVYRIIITLSYMTALFVGVFVLEDKYSRVILVTVATIAYAVLFNLFDLYKTIAGVVFIAVMMSGMCYIFTLPVGSMISADDEIHYSNSIKLSHLFEENVTEADEFIYGRLVTEKYNESIMYSNYAELEELYDMGAVNKDTGVSMNAYKTISYIPAAIAMFLARAISLPFIFVFYAGKIGNLLLYATLVYMSLKRLKSGKFILAVIALLPTNIFLVASYSYDVWLTGFMMLAISYIIGAIQDSYERKKVSGKDIAVIITAFVLGMAPKAVYFPLMLLMFLIPSYAYKSKKSYRGSLIVLCVGILFVLMTFMLPFVIGGPGEGDLRGGSGVNSAGQVKFILENPVEYTKILLNHIKVYTSPETQIDTVGSFMYMGKSTHFILIMIMLTMVTFLDREACDRVSNTWKAKALAVFSVFATIVLVSTAMYVSFTPVGHRFINGCQYRYIIPMILPILYFIFNIKLDNQSINKNIFGAVCICSMVFILYSDAWKMWISI